MAHTRVNIHKVLTTKLLQEFQPTAFQLSKEFQPAALAFSIYGYLLPKQGRPENSENVNKLAKFFVTQADLCYALH